MFNLLGLFLIEVFINDEKPVDELKRCSPRPLFFVSVFLVPKRLQLFLPVRFCTPRPPLLGPPAASAACLHWPSPTVWS